MTSRRSRRLTGLEPLHEAFFDYCFVCRVPIDIGALQSCVRLPCCNKFIQRRCDRELNSYFGPCGHCKVDLTIEEVNSLEEMVDLDALYSLSLEEIRRYQGDLSICEAFHCPGTPSYERVRSITGVVFCTVRSVFQIVLFCLLQIPKPFHSEIWIQLVVIAEHLVERRVSPSSRVTIKGTLMTASPIIPGAIRRHRRHARCVS